MELDIMDKLADLHKQETHEWKNAFLEYPLDNVYVLMYCMAKISTGKLSTPDYYDVGFIADREWFDSFYEPICSRGYFVRAWQFLPAKPEFGEDK